jgi:hypothetical protein
MMRNTPGEEEKSAERFYILHEATMPTKRQPFIWGLLSQL